MTISAGLTKRKRGYAYIEISMDNWKGVKAETIGQYTGLKDKNGVKIFEGDLIDYKTYKTMYRSYSKEPVVVVFFDGAFRVSSSGDSLVDILHNYNGYEVVGNIHQGETKCLE